MADTTADQGDVTVYGYTRSSFRMRSTRPLTDADARSMIGHHVEVNLGGGPLCSGTITDARIVDGAANLLLTVESGGRSCAACGYVYPEDQASAMLRPAEVFHDATTARRGEFRVYRDLPRWAPVCAAYGACHGRRTGSDTTTDTGE